MKKVLQRFVPFTGACLLLLGLSGTAFANGNHWGWGHSHRHWHASHHAPELDPATLGSGLGLLGGIILLLKERRRK